MASLDILVIGGVGVDTVVRVPALPLPQADSLMVPPVHTLLGHTGNGVVRGAHALGMRAAVVDVIGDDPEGALIRSSFEHDGIPASFATNTAGTRRSVNLVSPDGRRLSLYDARADGFEPDPALWRNWLAGTRHVHVSIMDWARRALPDALGCGATTSTDLHDWDGRSDYHRDFAYGADTVFVSATALADEAGVVADIFSGGRAGAVIVMDGERGARIWDRAAPASPVRVPAVVLPDRPAIDSNGAGDSFVAAFLHARLMGRTLAEAGRAGAVGGAWACGSADTHTSFINRQELEAALRL